MKLVVIISWLVIVFILSVLGVMVVKKCSVKDAALICKSFIQEIFITLFAPTSPLVQQYPVLVGWDGVNRIIPELVDDAFSTVRNNFSVCYCLNYDFLENGNIVRYHFDIMRKEGTSIDDDTLERLIQKQSEEILYENMRRYNFYVAPEPLTAVNLFPNALYIAFARNANGIDIIAEYKKNWRKQKMLQKTKTLHTHMVESWDDAKGE